jgi:hypothetical protein
MECWPGNNVAEGSYELEFYTRHAELHVENLELAEPLEFSDRYNVNKYGVIFRERLYVLNAIMRSQL